MGAASACTCSSPCPGVSAAPSTGIPADRVSLCPPHPAKAGNIYVRKGKVGPREVPVAGSRFRASAGLLLSPSFLPGRRDGSLHLFSELL